MQEAFLHYLWQAQRFLTTNLQTTANERIRIIKTGFLNANSGPDFINARLQIGGVEWAGNVEVHIKASDWYVHRHETDRAYDNVVLHVVWEANQDVFRLDGSKIPVLELQSITSKNLLEKQQQLVDSQNTIPCGSHFETIREFTKSSMLGVALTQRLQNKAAFISELLENNASDWEETTYQVLAKNFGFKLNAEPMLQLAQSIPLKILQKHQDNLLQVEALLFGVAGFLENSEDDYSTKLKKEYDFLASKYGLKSQQMKVHEWRFLRTRPANFPTVRLAQLASLVVNQRSFFSLFVQTVDIEFIKKALSVEQSKYWQEHYQFNKKLAKPLKNLGQSSTESLLINSVVPILVYYSQYIDNQDLIERAERLLESLPAEKNRITEQWGKLGLNIKTGFDSQASIELFNNFCAKKKCLSCRIGAEILGTTSD